MTDFDLLTTLLTYDTIKKIENGEVPQPSPLRVFICVITALIGGVVVLLLTLR